ncbi:MAG: type I-B CRISPR-associated protein Cas8b1/Cst1 [Peptococcaceae bacterium]|nr:type I-B CRISPR-associated protein Cas8b1/Cst1 [Peptococcaceae bacterium]
MKNNTHLKLVLGDWQWNASIYGFINIVGKENVDLIEDTVTFSTDLLEGFAEKYFGYFIRTYEKTLSWYKIVSFAEKMEAYEDDAFAGFNLEALKSFNIYLKDVKRFLKSNSYKAAYELITLNVDMPSLEKQLTAIKEPKDQQQFEAGKSGIITEVQNNFIVLRPIIAYCNSPEGKKYIRAKNVIYTIINNAWDGVSFLDRQPKEKDVYTSYKKYFVDGAVEYLQQNKSHHKYNCFICDAPIKDLNHTLSFLNETGFDVGKKSSHVWDFQNDIALCPLCKLIYSCLPAGLAYGYNHGLYINANQDVETVFKINHVLKTEILGVKEGNIRTIYPILVNALHQKEHDTAKYELADIQVVRYENDSYRFNILSRKMLEIIVESKDELDGLLKAVFMENGMTVRVYDEVIVRIFNNQNLFTLIHRMIYHKLANPARCYFNGAHIMYLLKINQKIYTRLGGMEVERGEETRQNQFLIGNAKEAGQNLRKRYYGKDAQHKLPGICYRLLNALKTANKDMFMDVTLNCYLYVRAQVPEVITRALSNEKDFSTMGYAFVAALIDEPEGKSLPGEKENTAPEAGEEELV